MSLNAADAPQFAPLVKEIRHNFTVSVVLCKFLCHNLTCLIQEQEALGIAPIFWKDESEEIDGDILPMRRDSCFGG